MLNDLYNKRILALAADIPHLGRLENPQASAKAHSKLCGSTVVVDVVTDGGKVIDFAHDVKACALGQASSSIMARHVIGADFETLRSLRERMHAMLKEDGAADFDGDWEDLNVLEAVRDFRSRHASTLLTFDAVIDAINQVEAAKAEQPQECVNA